MKNADKPITNEPDTIVKDGDNLFTICGGYSGLTKRELFAGMAMQGILAYPAGDAGGRWQENIAGNAVEMADALLEALGDEDG